MYHIMKCRCNIAIALSRFFITKQLHHYNAGTVSTMACCLHSAKYHKLLHSIRLSCFVTHARCAGSRVFHSSFWKLNLCAPSWLDFGLTKTPRNCPPYVRYSTSGDPVSSDKKSEEDNLTIFQKFKKAYKEQGKVLVAVHVITSTVWVGSFYTLVKYGIDIGGLMKAVGLSEELATRVSESPAGDVATVYLLYKICTPARYIVTLGGTNLVIRQMRKTGRMDPVPEGAKFKDLYQDGKEIIKEKRDNIKDKTDDLIKEKRESMKEKREEIVDKIKEKRDNIKDKTDDLIKEKRESIREKREEIVDKIKEKRDDLKEMRDDFSFTAGEKKENIKNDLPDVRKKESANGSRYF